MDVKVFFFNPLRECCYVVWDEDGNCVVIDPGCYGGNEFKRLPAFVEENKLKVAGILLTHGHFDHIFGLEDAHRQWDVPVYIHPEDIFQVEDSARFAATVGLDFTPYTGGFREISDGETISCGSISLKTIWTPGHTAGSVCYWSEKDSVLFSGDTLFQGSVGRTDHPRGDYDSLLDSLNRKIAVLPPETDVFCGHGYPTTIGTELATNPFLNRH